MEYQHSLMTLAMTRSAWRRGDEQTKETKEKEDTEETRGPRR